MKPEDVPDDAARLAEEAWVRLATTAPPGAYDHEAIRRHTLAAVLPAHEQRVRTRLASELRVAAFAIATGDDPLAAHIWQHCQQAPDAPLTADDPRTIAAAAYRWLAAHLEGEAP